jgi:hypothetical protein
MPERIDSKQGEWLSMHYNSRYPAYPLILRSASSRVSKDEAKSGEVT